MIPYTRRSRFACQQLTDRCRVSRAPTVEHEPSPELLAFDEPTREWEPSVGLLREAGAR